MAEENGSTEKTGTGKRSMLKWVLIALTAIVLGGGGFFGYSLYASGNRTETAPADETEALRINIPIKSFVVNLMDMDKKNLGKHYLKVAMTFEIDAEGTRAALERFEPQIRDKVLFVLSNQSFSDLSTMEGKLQLKQSLLASVNGVVGKNRVTNIYFTEFVVQ